MTEAEERAIAGALKTARACLSGQLGAIEASWALAGFVHGHKQFVSTEDRNLFVAVQSETDDLPVGSLKTNWHPDFLPAKLEQVTQYEAAIVNQVKDACERLVGSL